MGNGFLHGKSGVPKLTGDAAVDDVLKTKTFYNTDARTKVTGTLELTGTAAAGDVLNTKTFYDTDAKTKRTGTMPNRGTVSTDISAKATEVTIAQGYHSGSGKVKIATAEQNKIITGNIKAGITILGVAGNSNVVDTSAGDATAAQILSDKKAYVDGALVTGTIPSKTAQTYTPGTSNQTISAGQYLAGAQTISGDADLVSANIKSGANIFGVAGKTEVVDTSSGDAVAGEILKGKKAWVDGAEVTGTASLPTIQTAYVLKPTAGAGTITFTGITLSPKMTVVIWADNDPYIQTSLTTFVLIKRDAGTINHGYVINGGYYGRSGIGVITVNFSGTSIAVTGPNWDQASTYYLTAFNQE